jgi:hypothetical protein
MICISLVFMASLSVRLVACIVLLQCSFLHHLTSAKTEGSEEQHQELGSVAV